MEMKSGEWYYGVPCANCGHFVAVFQDQSKGHIPLTSIREPIEAIPVDCPACKHSQFHQIRELQVLCH
jgi:ribosomal protein S27E